VSVILTGNGTRAGRATQKAAKAQRRNFDERPKYGTVQDTIYVEGETGLLSTGNEDDDGNERRKVPDWERKLNAMAT
jgi:hypothetical protein